MSYIMMRYGNRSNGDVEEYKQAGKEAKEGISMVMDAVESGDMKMVVEGAEMAFKAVKKMCEISEDMESQYGERRNGDMEMRDGLGGRMYGRYGNRMDGYGDQHRREWNDRDDRMMERRMRDARGRYM